MKHQQYEIQRLTPKKMGLSILVISLLIVGVMVVLNIQDKSIGSELDRSTFIVQSEADSAGGYCADVNGSCLDSYQKIVDFASSHNIAPLINGTKYKVDMSYKTGSKTYTRSTNPPTKKRLPTIFIEKVYSIEVLPGLQ